MYVVKPEDGGPERVVHRNLLTQCMFILVEGVSGSDPEEEESKWDTSETSVGGDPQRTTEVGEM